MRNAHPFETGRYILTRQIQYVVWAYLVGSNILLKRLTTLGQVSPEDVPASQWAHSRLRDVISGLLDTFI